MCRRVPGRTVTFFLLCEMWININNQMKSLLGKEKLHEKREHELAETFVSLLINLMIVYYRRVFRLLETLK